MKALGLASIVIGGAAAAIIGLAAPANAQHGIEQNSAGRCRPVLTTANHARGTVALPGPFDASGHYVGNHPNRSGVAHG